MPPLCYESVGMDSDFHSIVESAYVCHLCFSLFLSKGVSICKPAFTMYCVWVACMGHKAVTQFCEHSLLSCKYIRATQGSFLSAVLESQCLDGITMRLHVMANMRTPPPITITFLVSSHISSPSQHSWPYPLFYACATGRVWP